jgi:hypothetical protein
MMRSCLSRFSRLQARPLQFQWRASSGVSERVSEEVSERTSLIESTLQSLEQDEDFRATEHNLKKLGQVSE